MKQFSQQAPCADSFETVELWRQQLSSDRTMVPMKQQPVFVASRIFFAVAAWNISRFPGLCDQECVCLFLFLRVNPPSDHGAEVKRLL